MPTSSGPRLPADAASSVIAAMRAGMSPARSARRSRWLTIPSVGYARSLRHKTLPQSLP